jgi:hypothetical protein
VALAVDGAGNVGVGTIGVSGNSYLRNVFLAGNSALLSDVDNGVIAFYGGSAYNLGAGAVAYGKDHASFPGKLSIYTSPAGAFTERLTVLENGKVGIGVSTPSCSLQVNGPVRCASYTVATVPDAAASGAGAMIYVRNETGGAVLAFSDGSSWRRVTDRAVVA